MKRLLTRVHTSLRTVCFLSSYALLRLSHRPEFVRGHAVLFFLDKDLRSTAQDCLADALELLQLHDPSGAELLRKHVRYICVAEEGLIEYWGLLRSCHIPYRTLKEGPSWMVATALVHEATHGKLNDLGIKTDTSNQARIELVCLRREARTASRLPDVDDDLPERILSKYHLRWWEPDAVRQRRRAALDRLWERSTSGEQAQVEE